jgi:hypothetical protein
MWQLQRRLAKDLQNDTTFYNKLLTACQDVSACKPACFRPTTTLTGLISDIKSSIATYSKQEQETESFYTDRRYHSSNRKGKKCFVCGKSGCWSTNHTKDEKDRRIRQYISDFEGNNSEEDDDNQEASNFYFDIEPCSSYHNDPKAEAFWAEFAREGAT